MAAKKDSSSVVIGGVEIVLQLFAMAAVAVVCFFGWRLMSATWHTLTKERPSWYCTSWVRAVSIESTNADNGKYSDEQYVVKYEDGTVEGKSQGDIPYARCTRKVKVMSADAKPSWKPVDSYGEVNWER